MQLIEYTPLFAWTEIQTLADHIMKNISWFKLWTQAKEFMDTNSSSKKKWELRRGRQNKNNDR